MYLATIWGQIQKQDDFLKQASLHPSTERTITNVTKKPENRTKSDIFLNLESERGSRK